MPKQAVEQAVPEQNQLWLVQEIGEIDRFPKGISTIMRRVWNRFFAPTATVEDVLIDAWCNKQLDTNPKLIVYIYCEKVY